MARQELPREDLLREATALAERVELAVAGSPEHVVLGLRSNGAGSVYFTADRAYHFNRQGALRRAYLDGRLYKAEGGVLVELIRQRAAGEMQLVSRQLSEGETAQLLREFLQAASELLVQSDSGRIGIVGQIPEDGNVAAAVIGWLRGLLHGRLEIARRPHVDG